MTLKRGALGGAPLFAFMGVFMICVACLFGANSIWQLRILLFSVYALKHWRLSINFFEALRV